MYYIYHIPGVKIGCSVRPRSRVKSQGYTDYELLEKHIDIEIAKQREVELQKQYGYKVDAGNQLYDNKFSKMGSVGGKKTGKKKETIERLQNMSKLAASLSSAYGLTQKQKDARSNTGKKTGAVNILKGREIAWETNRVKTLAYDIEGNFIGEFISVLEAAESLNCKRQHISRVLRGLRKSTKGYTFKYK